MTIPIPTPDLSKWPPLHPGDPRYFIVFLSRHTTPVVHTSPGHVFVAWGFHDADNQECSYRAYGLYSVADPTTSAASFLFGPVPGQIEDEALNGYQSVGSSDANSLVIEVGGYEWTKTLQITQAMSQVPQPYVLGGNDCVTFMQNIAQKIGLEIPPRDLLLPPSAYLNEPADYLSKLKQTVMEVQHTADFVGPMIGSMAAGPGTKTFPDGSTWTGPVGADVPYGSGTYKYKNGTIYTGPWAHGEDTGENGPIGLGHWQFPDGAAFDGRSTKAGLVGSYTGPGFVFKGTLVNGLATGNGSLTYSNGRSYTGSFANGSANGQGTLTLPNGWVYTGSFANDLPNGECTLSIPGRSPIHGNFVNGEIPWDHGGTISPPSFPQPEPVQIPPDWKTTLTPSG